MARCIDHGIGRSTAYKDSFIFDLLLKAGIDTERCSSRRHRLGGFHFGLQTQETIVATAPAADVKDYVIADIGLAAFGRKEIEIDRKSVGEGKSVSVRVELGGRR